MYRERIKFHPEWEGLISNWAKSYIHKNFWRINHYYEFGDAYNDAFIKFETCKLRYPQVVEARHFMGLFQRALINHIHTLALERTHYIPASQFDRTGEDGSVYNKPLDSLIELPTVEFYSDLNSAPPEIRMLVEAIHTSDEAYRQIRKMQKTLEKITSMYELNEELCAIIKVDHNQIDLVNQLTEYLSFNGSPLQIREQDTARA